MNFKSSSVFKKKKKKDLFYLFFGLRLGNKFKKILIQEREREREMDVEVDVPDYLIRNNRSSRTGTTDLLCCDE